MGQRFDPELHIYWGLKGAGKTHAAAREIFDAIRHGINVWTNVPINPNGFPKPRRGKQLGKIYVSDQPEDVAYFRCGLWVYDEAYMKLNSRKWDQLDVKVHEYMAQSRKTKMKIIIIAQSFKRIDLVLREICDQYVRFEKNLFGLGYKKIFGMMDPVLDQYIDVRSEQHFYSPAIFRFYDTDALYGSLLKDLPKKEFKEIVPNGRAGMPAPASLENERSGTTLVRATRSATPSGPVAAP